jgi:hypothetical protein
MSWSVYGDYCPTACTKKSGTPGLDDTATISLQTSSPHARRTLDQFYYPALVDTSIRDGDQTISKWSGKDFAPDGKLETTPDSLLVMVDQLWCWVVNESLSPMLDSPFSIPEMLTYTLDTVISSFPSSYTPTQLVGFTSLYECVRKHAAKCETVWDLHSLLVKEATSLLFNQENMAFTDIIETYRWVTNKKVMSDLPFIPQLVRLS